jgi:hypothetical protein
MQHASMSAIRCAVVLVRRSASGVLANGVLRPHPRGSVTAASKRPKPPDGMPKNHPTVASVTALRATPRVTYMLT